MRKFLSVIIALAMIFTLLSGAISVSGVKAAATWYVDPSGTDDASHGTGPGTNAFKTIQYAVNDPRVASGDTINVAQGTYVEGPQIVIDKNLSIIGADKATTIIKPSNDTGTSGDSRGWWLVNVGVTLNLSKATLDGTGKLIWQAIRANGTVVADNVNFTNIQYNPSTDYNGTGIAIMGGTSGNMVSNCTFANMGRIGVIVYGTGTSATITNCLFTGKGTGNWLDYGIEVGAGATASITGNTITKCKGVALSDGSTSGGIYVTTYFGTGTQATITGNTLTDNTSGITVGYDASDTSVVEAHDNNIAGNDYGVVSNAPDVDATNNWWGDASGPYNATMNPSGTGSKVSDNVQFCPWALDSNFSSFNTLTITTASLPNGTLGKPYSATLQGSGGSLPYTWQIESGSLPDGLTLNGSTGLISGTPTILGVFGFTVKLLSTPCGSTTKLFVIAINPVPDITPPTITHISGIDINALSDVKTNKDTYTFTVEAYDESGIGRMVVKVNGIVQIDKIYSFDPVTIYLSEGVNTVEVIVYDTESNSASKTFKVIKDSTPPTITLASDIPESTSNPTLTLKGMVYDNVSGVKSLTVNNNDVPFTLDGNFETNVTLTQGANTITIEATDKLDNKGTKIINISYTQSQSKQSYMIVLKVNSPDITVNGIIKKIDAQGSKPIIKNGRTLLPIRTLIESLGGTVEWNAKEQKVTITLNGHSIILWIGKTTALVDGNKVTLDVAPQIINARTYIPLRFVSEHLGGSVNWDEKTQTVTIYYWP